MIELKNIKKDYNSGKVVTSALKMYPGISYQVLREYLTE